VLSKDVLIRLCRARDLLRETHATLSIEDIARQSGMSPFHFIRQFAAVFGETPHQFRIGTRLNRAKLLLAAGQHSVTEVCMEVGFTSLGSFSDSFTRRVGASPSLYQRRARALAHGPGVVPAALTPGCFELMCRAARR
jgi:AraC-like DNA-binding protein